MPVDRSQRRQLSLRTWMLAAVLTAAGCVSNPPIGAAHTPWQKVQHLLSLDLSASAFARRANSLSRLRSLPDAEFHRLRHIRADLERAMPQPQRRLTKLPPKAGRLLADERQRLTHLWQRLPAPPSADALARQLASDLEHTGMLLGLERRPLGEPSDPEHRTDPDDDRPLVSWWERLRRRILP